MNFNKLRRLQTDVTFDGLKVAHQFKVVKFLFPHKVSHYGAANDVAEKLDELGVHKRAAPGSAARAVHFLQLTGSQLLVNRDVRCSTLDRRVFCNNIV